MGKGSSGGSSGYTAQPTTSTTVQQANTQPWSGQQPYLEDVFGQAQALQQTPLQWYSGEVSGVPTGQTYAPLASQTTQALNMAENTALTNQVPQVATNFATDMLGGNYLSAGNPYFSNMVNSIQKTVQPSVESQFEKSGRYGSGAMDNAFASAMTDTAGNLAYQNYANILGEMGKASYTAPQTAELGYLPAQELGQVGATYTDQTQNAINQAMQQWQFNQTAPWQELGMYGGLVGGNYGGTSTSSGTTTGTQMVPSTYGNSTGSTIGGLLGGLGSLGMLGYTMFGSDKRFKDNIKPLDDNALAVIVKIKPVTYDYKPEYGGNKDQAGFIADDLERKLPSLVFRDDKDMRIIAPMGLIPYLVKGMQEQQEQIDSLMGYE